MKRKNYMDEFAVLKVTDLYRYLFGPKGDRLYHAQPDPPRYRLTWQQGHDVLTMDCLLKNQRLFVRTSLMTESIEVPLCSYSQGVFGGAERYAFQCPECERRVFHLFAPSPSRLTRPDGIENRREPLCYRCHDLAPPSWRYTGSSQDRALLQKSKLDQQLGPKPLEREKGCSVTRHQRRFNRYIAASQSSLPK